MTTDKNAIVVKSNKLIEAGYKLDLVEQRIILAAIVEARESNKALGDGFITLNAKSFSVMFNMDEHSVYNQLKVSLDTLFNRFVVIRDIHPESGHERVNKIRWISSASYIDGSGSIQFQFSPSMIPYISRLESEFTKYRLEKIGKMTSAHAIRLYELLIQYVSYGSREIEINWLRKILLLENEYSAIKDFKKRVLDVAVTQINSYSDIIVNYDQKKIGKTISHFIFDIKLKNDEKQIIKKNEKIITREYIEKNAYPGESYDDAYERLSKK